MTKNYKVVVNMVKGEQAINLAVQNGQALRIWVVEGANYLLHAEDERAAVASLAVKAKRVGQDLELVLDEAETAQVILIGYFDVAQASRTPLFGRLADGTLREYEMLGVESTGSVAVDALEGPAPVALVLRDAAAPAVGALLPLATGPGAWLAAAGGVAAVAGGGGSGAGSVGAPLSPEAALRQLQNAARDNTAKDLPASLYQSAGVHGLSAAHVEAINDVLNSAVVTDVTVSSLQKMVDAYAKVFRAADHLDGNMGDVPAAEDYEVLAISGVTQASARMLSDVVDGQAGQSVDTVAELQALADAAKAVLHHVTQDGDAPTASQINSLLAGLPSMGHVVVTNEAEKAVQNAIRAANTDADGAIANQNELADIVKTAMAAFNHSIGRIIGFASRQEQGLAGQAIPPDSMPTLVDYSNVGVRGVSEANRVALNDALASKVVDGAAVLTPDKLQVVIDAYNAILAAANGAAPVPSRAHYAAIGADIGTAGTDAQDFALFTAAVVVQKSAGVDTIAEIHDLARITNAIQAIAAGQSPSISALTVADFAKIGLNTQGLSDNSPDQKAALFSAIAAKADDGSQTDSLQALQAIIAAVLPGSVSPVVLDLNGDGALSYTSLLMDVDGDGQIDRTAWVGADDGVLVRDVHGDGRVSHPSEFAFARHPHETDVQGLAAQYDSNQDGQLDAQDAMFGEFKIWRDANGNGVSDAGELQSLQALGLSSISLHSDGVQHKPVAGVTEMGHVHARRMDGLQMLGADAAFEHVAAQVHATPLEGHLWRLDVTGAHQTLKLSNLRAVYGDVRELQLSGQGDNTLTLDWQDVLDHPLQVDGDASSVLQLFTGGQAPNVTLMEDHGIAYQVYDCNRDGQMDLWVQQVVAVQI